MVLGHMLTVKDGSTNVKCPPRYFPWGGGGMGVGEEKLKLMLTQSSCAGAGTELGKSTTFLNNCQRKYPSRPGVQGRGM